MILVSETWPQQCPYSLAPVYKDGEFLGRRDELDKLHGTVSDRRNTRALISGPRRFGKTSLLYRLKHELAELGTQSSLTWIALRLAKKIRKVSPTGC